MIFLNKIQNFEQLSKVNKTLNGFDNPATAVNITKSLYKEMVSNLKDKYKVEGETLNDYKNECIKVEKGQSNPSEDLCLARYDKIILH